MHRASCVLLAPTTRGAAPSPCASNSSTWLRSMSATRTGLLLLLLLLLLGQAVTAADARRLVIGVNYVPSYARNDIAIWQDFDPVVVQREQVCAIV